MNYCPKCGRKIQDGIAFCPDCGENLSNTNSPMISNMGESVVMHKNDGNIINKCPNCGSLVKYMSIYCEYCGAELSCLQDTNSVKYFAEKIHELRCIRAQSKISVFSAFGIGQRGTVEEKIISLITDFQIPNSVGDITEFMILAASSINPITFNEYGLQQSGAKSIREWSVMKKESSAWLMKMEQAYNKALVFFSNSSDFQKIDNIYQRTQKEIANERKRGTKRFIMLIAICLAPLIIIGIFLSISSATKSKDRKDDDYTIVDTEKGTEKTNSQKKAESDKYNSTDVFDFDSLGVDHLYPQSDINSPLFENISVIPEIVYSTLGSENKLVYTPYIVTGEVIATFDNIYEANTYFGNESASDDESDFFSFVVENENGKIWICDLASTDVVFFKEQIKNDNAADYEWCKKFVEEFGGYQKYDYPQRGEKVAVLALYIGYSTKNDIATCYFGINKMFYDYCRD